MYVIVCGCVFTFVIWKLEADTVEYWHPKVRNCLTTFSYIKPICVFQVIHNIPWICSHPRDLLYRTRMRGPLSQETCCGRRPASFKGTIGSAISVFWVSFQSSGCADLKSPAHFPLRPPCFPFFWGVWPDKEEVVEEGSCSVCRERSSLKTESIWRQTSCEIK